MKVLGVEFFECGVESAILNSQAGGLVVAPSGPGLSTDLLESDSYRKALSNADLVLPDSGLMCLWLRIFRKVSLRRVSGLEYLFKLLEAFDFQKSSFWVMPNSIQSKQNLAWLNKKYNAKIDAKYTYISPFYPKFGAIEDHELLESIESTKPNFIFIQIGGGTQERLGLYLKSHLSFKPTIICTGAALAFLSGQQIRIPTWADRFYLGWLFRCLSDPKTFIPRYFSAFRLVYLLFKYGENPPV